MSFEKHISIVKLQQLHRSINFLSAVNFNGEMTDKGLLVSVVGKDPSDVMDEETQKLKRLMEINQERTQLIADLMIAQTLDHPDFEKLIEEWLAENTIHGWTYTLLEIESDDTVRLLGDDDCEPDEEFDDNELEAFLKTLSDKYCRNFSLPHDYFGK